MTVKKTHSFNCQYYWSLSKLSSRTTYTCYIQRRSNRYIQNTVKDFMYCLWSWRWTQLKQDTLLRKAVHKERASLFPSHVQNMMIRNCLLVALAAQHDVQPGISLFWTMVKNFQHLSIPLLWTTSPTWPGPPLAGNATWTTYLNRGPPYIYIPSSYDTIPHFCFTSSAS